MVKCFEVTSKSRPNTIAKDLYKKLNNKRIKTIKFIVNKKHQYVAKFDANTVSVTKIEGKKRKIKGSAKQNAKWRLLKWIDPNKLDWIIVYKHPESIDYLKDYAEIVKHREGNMKKYTEMSIILSIVANPDPRAFDFIQDKLNDFSKKYNHNDIDIRYDFKNIIFSLFESGNQKSLGFLYNIIIRNELNLPITYIHEIFNTIGYTYFTPFTI